MDLSGPQTLVVDVGGGSVELIVGDSSAMIHGQSLKLGAIRMKDLYLRDDPPPPKMLRNMREAIDAEIASTLKRFRFRSYGRLVGTSGMVANLTEIIHQRRTGRPVPQLHMATVTLKEVEAAERELVEADLPSRLKIPGLDPKRADTLLPDVTVLRLLMERSGQEVLTACDCGIREGLIYDFIERHRERIRTEQEIPNVRRRNVISLARRCQYLESHSRHVADLATRLFDATKPLHQLGEREREWLEYAAILHDVGYLINSRSHHKHGYYLIMNSELFGFTADEIAVLATIVRYHRRALPKPKHREWKALPTSLRKPVAALSALLRIADALDRSQFSVIRGVLVKLGKPVAVQLDATSDAELEIWAARGRADLFARVFKRPMTFTLRSLKRATS
jgi:exopolyphosphatase/guanosine-5'-triphosphate,3'-diphosphate pyrophosphatase